MPNDGARVVVGVILWTAVGSAGCRSCSQETGAAAALADASAAPRAAHDAAAPYAPSRSAPDDSPAPLSVVESALFKLRPQLNVCYRAASKDDPRLAGQAVLAVTIGLDGHVTGVATESQTGLDASMMACVTDLMKAASFPPPADGGPTLVKVPLAFRPRRDAGR